MICPKCKTENEKNFNYCSNCGEWMPPVSEGEEYLTEDDDEGGEKGFYDSLLDEKVLIVDRQRKSPYEYPLKWIPRREFFKRKGKTQFFDT